MTITRYELSDGKLVVIIEGVGKGQPVPAWLGLPNASCPAKRLFHQWPGEEFEPLDVEILDHTVLREVKAEVRGF